MAARARVVHVPYMVDVPPAPGLVKIDSLESVDEAALRRFMDGERPQGDPYADGTPNPYADGAPNLRAT